MGEHGDVGNSVKDLSVTQFIPLFAGIALGVALGTMPVSVPWLPQPVRLGLAGGPLVVALVVSHFGRVGRLVFYMPPNVNLAGAHLGFLAESARHPGSAMTLIATEQLARQSVTGQFVLDGGGQVSFQVGAYDHSAPLVIAPARDGRPRSPTAATPADGVCAP